MTPAPTTYEEVTPVALPERFASLLGEGMRVALVAGHDDGDRFRVVYVLVGSAASEGGERSHELVLTLDHDQPRLPSLASLDFATSRFEREIVDLFGVSIADHPLARRLVRHSHWPSGWHPMRRDAGPNPGIGEGSGVAPFVEVSGNGVYEIPVGPVHAGLIEPGHFRFSVVGETVLQLKARLWYVHRGVEKLFEGRRPQDGFELAERISGDTAVGHSLAYAQAVEQALGVEVPEPALVARALLLELERLHNHVADLGMLANDVAYGISNAHAQRLRERLLRLNRRTTGHRLLRGGIVLGGARLESLPDPAEVREVVEEMAMIAGATLSNSTVRDRFNGTAVLAEESARGLGTLGYVARASGIAVDARADHPRLDLGPAFEVVTEPAGDVMARYRVRLREVAVSAAVATDLISRLDGHHGTAPGDTGPAGMAHGLGLVEGWRGTIAHRVEIGGGGTLSLVKIVDPSFFNWPALPVAMADTIVPDFPLANKSFNQSYAGNDL